MAAKDQSKVQDGTERRKPQDHDRVVMLSVRADGTPDQHDPELIGQDD